MFFRKKNENKYDLIIKKTKRNIEKAERLNKDLVDMTKSYSSLTESLLKEARR